MEIDGIDLSDGTWEIVDETPPNMETLDKTYSYGVIVDVTLALLWWEGWFLASSEVTNDGTKKQQTEQGEQC